MSMKNKLSILSFLLISSFGFGQLNAVKDEVKRIEVKPKDTLDGWKKEGKISFLVNQSAFSNWVSGGENSVAGNINLNYNLHYKKGTLTWDNLLLAGYGLANTKSNGTRKTDDRLEINSILGKEAFGHWSYSLFANLKTQLFNGYNYDLDNDKIYPTSGFFKPAYLSFGPGLMWRKSGNLNFNLAPVTSKVTILSGDVNTFNGKTPVSSKNTEIYGVKPNEFSRYELGFYASGYYKTNLMENISMENILSLYSNYLENPKNVDLDYTMNLILKINKYLSTNLTVQAVYDDNAFAGLQIREVFGLGINMNL